MPTDTYRSGGKIHTMRKKQGSSLRRGGRKLKKKLLSIDEGADAMVKAAGEAAKQTAQKVRAKKKTDNMKRMKKAKESAEKRKSTPKTYTV